MGLVHRQARIPISGFGCPKMHAMVGVSLSMLLPDAHIFFSECPVNSYHMDMRAHVERLARQDSKYSKVWIP